MKWTEDEIRQEAMSISCPWCGVNAYRRCIVTKRGRRRLRIGDEITELHRARLAHAQRNLRRTVKQTARETRAQIIKVDLINASPQLFCETLRLAASIGVTDAMANIEARSAYDLAVMLCERGKYRYEHMNMLHEAYESGLMFMELRGQPTNMKWGTQS